MLSETPRVSSPGCLSLAFHELTEKVIGLGSLGLHVLRYSSSMSTTTPRISFASLTPNNIGTVRKLNSVLFPIKYSERFYQDLLLPEVENFCKLGTYRRMPEAKDVLNQSVYYNDIPVGTICCRLENKDDQSHLYLMTMGILAVSRKSTFSTRYIEVHLRSLIARGDWALKALN